MLLFRDWLRNHADDRLLYEETKRELAARTWKYTQNYADAKSEVVEEILARARRNMVGRLDFVKGPAWEVGPLKDLVFFSNMVG
jgi:hypothetical protein